MSSAQQPGLASLQLNDYVALATLTAVGYDYVLTFSKEIEYIWSKPWTWVTTLFVLVRYAGLLAIAISCLYYDPIQVGSSFLPGPAKTYVFVVLSVGASQYIRCLLNSCEIVNLIGIWSFVFFLGAADFVMILRVWAMYNRSRLVFSILLTSFFLEIILNVLTAAINNVPGNLSVVVIQIQEFSFCAWKATSHIPHKLAPVLQMMNGAAMCLLAIVQFVRQALQMYRVTKQWQVNQYINLLIRQGILYFLVIFALCLFAVLGASGKVSLGAWRAMPLTILETVPLYTLIPRFVISIRELYARDIQGRCEEGIDTGFGLSLPGRGAGEMPIVFADAWQDGDVEEIQTNA